MKIPNYSLVDYLQVRVIYEEAILFQCISISWKWRSERGTAYSKLDCNAGTFLRSKVNTVTNPNAPAANHSGTAAQTSANHNKNSKSSYKKWAFQDRLFNIRERNSVTTSCLWLQSFSWNNNRNRFIILRIDEQEKLICISKFILHLYVKLTIGSLSRSSVNHVKESIEQVPASSLLSFHSSWRVSLLDYLWTTHHPKKKEKSQTEKQVNII